MIGILGTGSFGISIASLVAKNHDVLVYGRTDEVVQQINNHHVHGYQLSTHIQATRDPAYFTKSCNLLFPVVPSESFRSVMKKFSPYINPEHFIIHGTKGLDIATNPITHKVIYHTMSEIITQETSAIRIGVMSGPNLASEIMQGMPGATLVASKYDEVIKAGQHALRSPQFQVYGSHEVKGAELCGALKNIIAIGSGILYGKGFGKNAWGLLISRGLLEMSEVGKALGADINAFLGVAGIGDLVATASSESSRNFTLGFRLGKGETIQEILATSHELAEGYHTLKVVQELVIENKIFAPIMQMLYRTIFGNVSVDEGISALMSFPHNEDAKYF